MPKDTKWLKLPPMTQTELGEMEKCLRASSGKDLDEARRIGRAALREVGRLRHLIAANIANLEVGKEFRMPSPAAADVIKALSDGIGLTFASKNGAEYQSYLSLSREIMRGKRKARKKRMPKKEE